MIKKEIILFLLVILLVSGCAGLKYSSWFKLESSQHRFEIMMPSQPRHFTMYSSSDEQEYNQWTSSDPGGESQYFVFCSQYEKGSSKGGIMEQLKELKRPAVGFLDKAQVEKSSFKEIEGRYFQEEVWVLEKKTNLALSRICLVDNKVYQLVCLYPRADAAPEEAEYFFSSFRIRD